MSQKIKEVPNANIGRGGDYREIIETETDDRQASHLCGCIKAIESGKKLGDVIVSSTRLNADEFQGDDMFSSSKAIKDLLKRKL